MKKIATLLVAISALCSGCFGESETYSAINDYCRWESDCGLRSYWQCHDLYMKYYEDAPACDYTIINMSWAYMKMTCPMYTDYYEGNEECNYYQEDGYSTFEDCRSDMENVYRYDAELKNCLHDFGISYYGYAQW